MAQSTDQESIVNEEGSSGIKGFPWEGEVE